MGNRALAILWAQWRTFRNYLPRSNWVGVAFSTVLMIVWYGGFAFLATAAAVLISNPGQMDWIAKILPGGLLICFLYWQVMPLLMASMGSALDIKKLIVYPIPHRELFALEVLLRISTGIEVLMVLLGTGAGLLFNPKIPVWAPLGLLPFILFNLFLSAGVRELLKRVLARKYFRECAALLFVLAAALPQALMMSGNARLMRRFFSGQPAAFWPWNATAQWLQGRFSQSVFWLCLAWTALAYFFGRWQFGRSLRFDTGEQTAGSGSRRKGLGLVEAFYRLPGQFLPDPLSAVIEKELRFLTRSARFRLVFLMGFSFGLLIWIPVTIGRTGSPDSFMGRNYLTCVSIYALLLLSDVLFWNAFGFDRSAAQIYFLFPVRLSRILVAKNVAAMLFVLIEITAIVTVCAIIRLPMTAGKLVEAYLVPAIVSLYLMSIGNLTSIYSPRSINPARSFRSSAGGRTQAALILLFPAAMLPVALAYMARYAFDSSIAFYVVLSIAGVFGGVVYSIAMDSAVSAAERRKELMLTALSIGSGPVEA